MEENRLTAEEIDTIGEIMNISMGAAATAVSTMLERQVVITTPRIEQNNIKDIDCSDLEPAIVVKINYIEGLTGTNIYVLRRNDMRIILDLLMGNDLSEHDESFEFDDMSMSAACEVMNQMMGASSTALSELLGITINISTPQAVLIESNEEVYNMFQEFGTEEDVMAISFKMTIKETLDTSFSSIMPLALTRNIVQTLNNNIEDAPIPPAQPTPQPVPQQTPPPVSRQAPQPAPQQVPQPSPQQVPQQVPQPTPQPIMQPVAAQQMPNYSQQSAPQAQPMQNYSQQSASQVQQTQYPQQAYEMPYQQPYQQQMPEQYQYNNQNPQQAGTMPYQMPYPQQNMQQQYGNEYYQPQYNQYIDPHANLRYASPTINVKQADFPEFAMNGKSGSTAYTTNINMLMGVQLEVSVIVGHAKQKIKEVLDFGQGSVIELDKQTGAPAEIMVNGQLLAYGDVVVVGDNFGVRITEIVGTKELLDSLDVKK